MLVLTAPGGQEVIMANSRGNEIREAAGKTVHRLSMPCAVS